MYVVEPNTDSGKKRGILKYQRVGNTIVGPTANTAAEWLANSFVWDCSTIMTQFTPNPAHTGEYATGLQLSGEDGIAMARINGHDTMYAVSSYLTWPGQTSYYALGMFRDLNGDGDAMDNEIGEIKYILFPGTLTNGAWDDPSGSYWYDIEYTENAEGKKFLLIMNNQPYSQWSASNDYLMVLELDDNGDFTGGNDRAKRIEYEGCAENNLGGLTGWGALGSEFEFDSNLKVAAVPEPATLLVLGTGILGALGWVRRRRTG